MKTLSEQVSQFDRTFRRLGTRKRAEGEKRYLKSSLDFYGVTMPHLRTVAKDFRQAHPDLKRPRLLSLVRALWKNPYFEMRMLGIGLLEEYQSLLTANDLDFVEKVLRKCDSWAQVDWLAGKVAGRLVDAHPKLKKTLKRWAKDDNFWIRRSSLLALMGQLRREGGDFELFTKLATPMLHEKEFFIRKAIGWVLRDTSRRQPQLVCEYVEAHVDELSGLSYREATRRLPIPMRKKLDRLRAET